jgi:hypothetical protein
MKLALLFGGCLILALAWGEISPKGHPGYLMSLPFVFISGCAWGLAVRSLCAYLEERKS